jgi:hypothetical protein
VKISHIFSSDLQRAFKTAEAIRTAQCRGPESVIRLRLLREQDFGFYEGKHFERSKDSNKSTKEAHLQTHRTDPGFQDVESKESMRLRVDTFIDKHLLGHLEGVDGQTVAVVAHGIILSHLWRAILRRFSPGKVTVAPDVGGAHKGMGLEYLGGWSNTGYLDLEIRPQSTANTESERVASEPPSSTGTVANVKPSAEGSAVWVVDSSASRPASSISHSVSQKGPLSNNHEPPNLSLLSMTLVVKAVNSQDHLKGLKKTRGGIGSSEHDSSQQTVDSFFKKRKTE